jgi:hypothetical protein
MKRLAAVSLLLALGCGNHAVFPVGARPHAVLLADVNQDGTLDAVTANEDDDTVSVLLGLGDGSFEEQRVFFAGDGPVSLAVADFDEDGTLDIAASNFSAGFAGDVSLFFGDGNGDFAPEIRITADEGPIAVVNFDLDGDGDQDLAVSHVTSLNLQIFENQNGNFVLVDDQPLSSLPKAINVADLDADGDQDLIVSENFIHSLGFFINQNGQLAPETLFVSGSVPTSVAASDVDQDGNLDLIVSNSGSGDALALVAGLGAGQFDPQVSFLLANVNPVAVIAADLDGDGLDDIAAANSNSFDVSILLNQGGGVFPALAPDQNVLVGDGPNALAVGDLDGDGALDLVTSNSFTNDISVLLNDGNGFFALVGAN